MAHTNYLRHANGHTPTKNKAMNNRAGKRRTDYSLLPPLATRVKTITGISTDLPNLQFLETLLRDASRLARQ